ncbi:hypothetical protein PINS_up009996 [Pythium insidiosum]|nr:hypothetical protein PINS_up009996 [Pythium insidiosum]
MASSPKKQRTAPPPAPRDVCIVAVARTPCGSFQGKLASLSAPELAGVAIRAAVERAGVQPSDVEELIVGHVLSAGVGQSPAKQAARHAGLPVSVPCSSVNKVCASGMKGACVARALAGLSRMY